MEMKAKLKIKNIKKFDELLEKAKKLTKELNITMEQIENFKMDVEIKKV